MTRDEAIAKARAVADEEGWTWREPIHVALETASDPGETILSGLLGRLSRRLGRGSGTRGGPKVWQVHTNAGSRGVNVVITLDDETGEVLQKAFWPR